MIPACGRLFWKANTSLSAGRSSAGNATETGMFDAPEDLTPESLPGEPTDALPGTERKIRILIERAARREPLFHPLDGCKKRLRFHVPLVAENTMQHQNPALSTDAHLPDADLTVPELVLVEPQV
jgi:hypothetical protein